MNLKFTVSEQEIADTIANYVADKYDLRSKVDLDDVQALFHTSKNGTVSITVVFHEKDKG